MKRKLVRFVACFLAFTMILGASVVDVYAADDNAVNSTDTIDIEGDGDTLDSVELGEVDTEDVPEEKDKEQPEAAGVTNQEDSEKIEDSEKNDGIPQEKEDGEEKINPEEDQEINFNYVYVEKSYVKSGEEQNIVISWGENCEQVDSMKLVYTNQIGEQFALEESKKSNELFLFQCSLGYDSIYMDSGAGYKKVEGNGALYRKWELGRRVWFFF